MLHKTVPEVKKAVLVGIQLPKVSRDELESSLAELTRLVETLGYHVVGQVTQKRSSEKSATVLGEGKRIELAKWTGGTGKIAAFFEKKKTKAALRREVTDSGADDLDFEEPQEDFDGDVDVDESEPTTIPSEKADVVIVDAELSPSQLRNLESASGVPVLDRTGVIIEIFSRHAKTKAARLQVEIARLTYIAPRLRESSSGGDRQGGGIGGKGSGETSLELDKRKIRDRIKELKVELSAIGNEHAVRRARRSQEISVALVGYTNAGKSSLMRALTGSDILVADKLFATLDTTVRPLFPESQPRILISDTVGFIKKLPHDLVASFKSTLDEALHASLLLFVVDCSDPAFRSQLKVTQAVLEEVGATDVPRLLVLNKRDKISSESQAALAQEFQESILISTRSSEDLKSLRERIIGYFETDMVEADLQIPYDLKGIIGEVRSKARVLTESYNEHGVLLRIKAHPNLITHLVSRLRR